MNLRVFFIYICKTAHFGWLLFFNILCPISCWLFLSRCVVRNVNPPINMPRAFLLAETSFQLVFLTLSQRGSVVVVVMVTHHPLLPVLCGLRIQAT